MEQIDFENLRLLDYDTVDDISFEVGDVWSSSTSLVDETEIWELFGRVNETIDWSNNLVDKLTDLINVRGLKQVGIIDDILTATTDIYAEVKQWRSEGMMLDTFKDMTIVISERNKVLYNAYNELREFLKDELNNIED